MIKLLHGDCTGVLPTLEAGSVQCVVTSPPYYGLRDYGLPPTDWPAVEYTPLAGLPSVTVPAMSCCLGLESDPIAYVAHLVYVWRELRRVLRDDGVVFLNLGDSYAGGSAVGFRPGCGRADGKVDERGQRNRNGTGAIAGLKPKDLLMIPARVALALQADGWYLRSDVIWSKPNPMPESVTDRPTKAHEYVFLLAKSERYFYDAEAIAEAASGTEERAQQRRARELAQQHGLTDEHIAAIRSAGATDAGKATTTQSGTGKNTDRVAALAAYAKERLGGYYREFLLGTTRNRRTVWTIATQPYAGAHFAVMPEALIRPCVLAGSAAQACEVCGAPWARHIEKKTSTLPVEQRNGRQSHNGSPPQQSGWFWQPPEVTDLGFRPSCPCPNDGRARSVILDPFAGSGTTLRVAEALGRDAIGIELNASYIDLQEQRTNGVQVSMEGYL